MEEQELVSIFSDGKVWINARIIQELLADQTLLEFDSKEVIDALQIIIQGIEQETVVIVSNQLLIDNGLMEE